MMNDTIVRIVSATIQNFKNVNNGTIRFDNPRKSYDASILGLYGQNGSGKTALIDAFNLLKINLCGQPIPAHYADFINIDAERANLQFDFSVENLRTKAQYAVKYQFSIRKDENTTVQNVNEPNNRAEHYKVTVFDEVLSYSYECGDDKVSQIKIVDTASADDLAFAPKSKYDILTGANKAVAMELLIAKKMAEQTSRSFIFSPELLNVIRNNCKEEYHTFLFESIVQFGNFELFIIQTYNSGLISLNALPLAFKYQSIDGGAAGSLMVPLNDSVVIPEDAVKVVRNVIHEMNIVLQQIIPGMTLDVRILGRLISRNGKKGCTIQLVSCKNKKEIPLRYESEGIKKIISILQLLIVVYNQQSITVVIDELDSGVFEYLLGELLRIISEKGKGQLIFTSHNLRPLETLDRGFIAFTTTNPNKRYIRLTNVKTNNNLRDFYYRDIVLGEQSEPVYDPTNNYEIALAFKEAGEANGS